MVECMHGFRSSVRGGPTRHFFSDKLENPNTNVSLKVGNHLPASNMPFQWCFTGRLVVPPLDPRMQYIFQPYCILKALGPVEQWVASQTADRGVVPGPTLSWRLIVK